jgi:uncharacterized membrane protein
MEYLVAKWLHVLSSTLLFGAGVGSAFHMLLACLTRDAHVAARVVRQVVWADWLFTATTVVLQPVTGAWMLYLSGLSWSTPWVRWSVGLYALALACWLPVVVIQYRLRDLAQAAAEHGAPLPPRFERLMRWWTALGVPAFVAFVAIFWLMVAKPS